MKVARFLLVPALLLALAGATHAQAPQGPVQLDPGPMMPGPTSHGSMGGEYCPPDMAGGPVYSDCCPDEGFQGILRKRTSRGYVKLDAVMLHRNDATNRTLFNLGSVAAGTPILTAGQPDFGFETLPRVTAGFVLMNDIALEATVWYKDDFDGIRDATSTTVPGPRSPPASSLLHPRSPLRPAAQPRACSSDRGPSSRRPGSICSST